MLAYCDMVARKAVSVFSFSCESVCAYVHARLSLSFCCVAAAEGSEKELKIVIMKRGLLPRVTWSLVS